jgi:NAD(P)H-dependent FMN reductase
MTEILLLCGSMRADSWNRRLLAHLASRMPTQVQVNWLQSSELDWPIFNEDLEHVESVRESVKVVHQRIARADGLIVASPEYNGMLSPFLKNVVDWVSRLPHTDPSSTNAWIDKPVLLCSASTGGSGGAAGLPSVRNLLAYLGACALGQTITVPWIHTLWSDDFGLCFEQDDEAMLADVLSRFVQFAA